jgi:hypothetical protein
MWYNKALQHKMLGAFFFAITIGDRKEIDGGYNKLS